jgi:hypothetical protein
VQEKAQHPTPCSAFLLGVLPLCYGVVGHPLSNLPKNVSRDILLEKYCKILEIVRELEKKK